MDDDFPRLAAHNDNDNDGLPRTPPCAKSEARDEPGPVLSFEAERTARDKRMGELESLMDEAIKLAKQRLILAQLEPEQVVEDRYLKQWVAVTGCYTKLLTAQHKHRQALREGR